MRIRTPGPLLADPVTGAPVLDPVTGVQLRAPDDVQDDMPAHLAHRPVAQVTALTEQRGEQDTVRSGSTILLPPAARLAADSVVTDKPTGEEYQVEGRSVVRGGLGGAQFRTAFLVRVSDLGGGS